MTTLTERLDTVDRQIVIDDTATLIDNEVANKSGLSGMAIKGGYKVVKKLKPNMIEEAVDTLLDDFSKALDPLYQEYVADDDATTFEAYLVAHDTQAANDLLGITDRRAEKTDHKVLKKTYGRLRGQAEKHVREALPGVGRLIDRHAPKE
jgi:hypothetical protein